MGEVTGIAWCDHTLNPWIGCAKVAPGCVNCYAENLMDTRYKKAKWGEQGTRVKTSPANWNKVRKWNREALSKFGRKARVFCASLADVAEDRPELVPWRAELCNLILSCPNLDFQLLTKRPENLTRLFPADVLARCWVGTSISNQADADRNISVLLRVNAAVLFVSAEPLIEAVDLNRVQSKSPGLTWVYNALVRNETSLKNGDSLRPLDWVICGGESGPDARPCKAKWIRSIVKQCANADVACFVKQLGSNVRARNDDGFMGDPEDEWNLPDWLDQVEHNPDGVLEEYQGAPVRVKLYDRKGADPAEWPEDLRVQEFPA